MINFLRIGRWPAPTATGLLVTAVLAATAVSLPLAIVMVVAAMGLAAAAVRRIDRGRSVDRSLVSLLAICLVLAAASVAADPTTHVLGWSPEVMSWVPLLVAVGSCPLAAVAVSGWVCTPGLVPRHSDWFTTMAGLLALTALALLGATLAIGPPFAGLEALDQVTLVAVGVLGVMMVIGVVAMAGCSRMLGRRVGLLVAAIVMATSATAAGSLELVGPDWSVALAGLTAFLVAASAASRGRSAKQVVSPEVIALVSSAVLVVVSLGSVVVAALTGHYAALTIAVIAGLLASGRSLLMVNDLRQLAVERAHAASDDLTGVANRRGLRQWFAERDAARRDVAVLVFDLEKFREVNQALGHAVADDLLGAVARRLQEAAGAQAVVARTGGDDFAVAVPLSAADGPLEQTGVLVQRLSGCFRRPFDVGGVPVHLSASVGATAGTFGEGKDALLRRAETARAEARRDRSGPVVHGPDPDRDDDGRGRWQLAAELRVGLEEEEIELFYQPQIDVGTGRATGVEALVRWRHPSRGLLSPFAFVALAESHGLMGQLTEYVLTQAVRQQAIWKAAGTDLRVAVNLSASNLLDDGLPGRVLALLHDHGVRPADLTLEVTENVLVGDSSRVARTLGQLAALGCDLSIDDYGTGWSSLGYLRRIPVRELKLDRSFTVDLLTDPRAAAIVLSSVELAHTLGLRVVAEGVEDDRTFHELAAMGCDMTQGYWHARPMPADEVVGWLAAHGPSPAALAVA